MASFHARSGDTGELKRLQDRFDEEAVQHQIVREEFGKMTPRRTYVAHGLPDKDVAAAAAKCVSIDGFGGSLHRPHGADSRGGPAASARSRDLEAQVVAVHVGRKPAVEAAERSDVGR